MVLLICKIYKTINELIYKTDVESQMEKINLWLTRDKRAINLETGVDMYTLLDIINN